MKKIIFVLPVFFTSFSLMSQTLKEIVSKTDNENFDAAAINFRTLIALEPNKGENYFSLAKIILIKATLIAQIIFI